MSEYYITHTVWVIRLGTLLLRMIQKEELLEWLEFRSWIRMLVDHQVTWFRSLEEIFSWTFVRTNPGKKSFPFRTKNKFFRQNNGLFNIKSYLTAPECIGRVGLNRLGPTNCQNSWSFCVSFLKQLLKSVRLYVRLFAQISLTHILLNDCSRNPNLLPGN